MVVIRQLLLNKKINEKKMIVKVKKIITNV